MGTVNKNAARLPPVTPNGKGMVRVATANRRLGEPPRRFGGACAPEWWVMAAAEVAVAVAILWGVRRNATCWGRGSDKCGQILHLTKHPAGQSAQPA